MSARIAAFIVGTPYRRRFLVRLGKRAVVVAASDVAWIRADRHYVSLVARDRKQYVVRTSLDRLESELDPADFVRVHRSAIVCVADVRGVEPTTGDGGLVVVLRDGTKVPVSRSRRSASLEALGGL